MAVSARELRYRSRSAVDGSLARDLDWAVRERELRHAGEVPRPREAAEAPKVRTVPRVQLRQAEKVSLLAVAGFMAVAVLALVVLAHYIQLTQLSAEAVELKGELASLQTENEILTAQYEQLFDLASVREAAEAMGMTKPSSSQIYYIDLTEGDSAVVYQEARPGLWDRIRSSLRHGMYAVVEYFD